MKHIFITYGDAGYESAKLKIVSQAKAIGVFEVIHSYGRADLSQEVLDSDIIKVKRGGGLWSWKPDVLYSTMLKYEMGDIVVYCDAGCSLYPSAEWNQYWEKLECYDLVAQRIFQRTDRWTRSELISYFNSNGSLWPRCYQYLATVVILKISEFTLQFVREWRRLMIEHLDFVQDVSFEERGSQHAAFLESRHDQAVYSSLVYKYINQYKIRNKIYTKWEHIEDYDFFYPQAIRATRLRYGQIEPIYYRIRGGLKRLLRDYILKLLYYNPIQWWYSRRNAKK